MPERTLRICLMKELPDILDRDMNYLYFAYDKLALFFGQDQYYDPFVICEHLPEDDPITGVLYITFDGTVYCYIYDQWNVMATIEDPSQADGLSKLGTMYFIYADRRYIDLRRRIIHLPYQNGTYSLSVDVAKNQMINDKTVIRYDTENERWYIDGEHYGPPLLRGYKGKTTTTVKTEVNQKCIHADLKIANLEDNLLQIVRGGLYATVSDKLEKSDVQQFGDELSQFVEDTNNVMADLKEQLDELTDVISEEHISDMIHEALVEYYDKIDELIAAYDDISDLLDQIEKESKAYTDEVFTEKSSEAEDLIYQVLAEEWDVF